MKSAQILAQNRTAMSANQNPRQSIPETSQDKQTECSNGTKAPAQPKRRRNRPSKSKKLSEPSKQNVEMPKSKENAKEEKFVHTVFGGMSKEKFHKQKDVRFCQQGKCDEQNELAPKSAQRKVTVTANKSVIVSILDPALHQDSRVEENVSSFSEANVATRMNCQAVTSLNGEPGQMEQNLVFELELEKNYVFRMKKVS